MSQILNGKVIGKNQAGIANLVVEFWGSDEQGGLLGTRPLLRSTTRSGGHFLINLQRLSPNIQLPAHGVLIFRYGTGVEVGRMPVTAEVGQGQVIHYEDPNLAAARMLDIWPREFKPPKKIPDDILDGLKLNPNLGLLIEGTPQVEYFVTYAYLWPSPLGTEEGQGEDTTALPLSQGFLLGVQVMHRQEWHLLGHARGELLHSLPLTPGEETTIEILTWDRNIYKREEEITSELQRELEYNRQFKDSHEVMREIEKARQWKAGGKLNANVLYKIVSFEIGGDIETAEQAKQINRSTLNTVVETTDRASTKIHNQRKTLISSTKEFGSEEKVTRKITNTNRCHSVTYHFFETLRNYKVMTSLASPAARPCIFWKQDPPFQVENLRTVEPNDAEFLGTMRWLHWNSHLINAGLLDRSFTRALEVLPDLIAFWHVKAVTEEADLLLEPAVRDLVTKLEIVEKAELDSAPDPYTVKTNINNTCLKDWIWIEVLHGNSQIVSLRQALADVGQGKLRAVVERFVEHWDSPVDGYGQVVDHIRDSLEMDHQRPYFVGPVLYLNQQFKETVAPEMEEELRAASIDRMRDVGEAVRLMRHIADNYLHYFQLIWSAKEPGQRLLEIAQKKICLPGDDRPLSDVIEPELLGFYADYAIFPYTKAEKDTDLDEIVQSFLDLENEPPRESQVVLPSNGIVVEPQLGDYMACEPFIQQHRLHDLKLKELEVEKARLENERRQKKIELYELDNPECCPSPEAVRGPRISFRGADQAFEHGRMIWRSDNQRIYVIYADNTWTDHEATFNPDVDPTSTGLETPEGLYEPVLGFGKVWREQPGVRDKLGWAIEEEHAYQGASQRFSWGQKLWARERIYSLHDDGTWTI